MKHLESISGDPTAALIICGDVCTKITLLEKTLILCKERFQAGKKLAIAGAGSEGNQRCVSPGLEIQ